MKRRTFKYVNHKPGLQLNQALMVFKFLPHSRLISPPCQPCEVQDMLFSQFDYEKIEVRDGRSAQGHKQCLFGVGVEIIFYFAFKIRAELRTTVSWFPVSQICWVPNWATGPDDKP